METSRVDGVKAPQHPNPGHWTTDLGLRHVLAQSPLDQILDALDLRPGVGAGLALAGHGDVCCRLGAPAAPVRFCRAGNAFFAFWRSGRIWRCGGVWQLAFRANRGSDDGASSSRQLRVQKSQTV